jgi:hypothetical protein
MKNNPELNKQYPEGNEYQNKNSKNSVPNNLKFTAIMFTVLAIVLPLMTYSMYNDLVAYENGGDIRINEIIWMFYKMGGKDYGKMLVLTVLVLATIMCIYQTIKYWKEYKIIRAEFKK